MPPSGAHPTLRFLVIGCGSIGTRHLANLKLLNAGEILACDPREDRRREASTRFDVEVPATLEEGWKRDPNVAVITTPTSIHVALAPAAAQRGCHPFIEKPPADPPEGPGELPAAAPRRR